MRYVYKGWTFRVEPTGLFRKRWGVVIESDPDDENGMGLDYDAYGRTPERARRAAVAYIDAEVKRMQGRHLAPVQLCASCGEPLPHQHGSMMILPTNVAAPQPAGSTQC
jgi:hypothetical protein